MKNLHKPHPRKERERMSSQVVRVEGFSKGSLGAIGKEVEREEKELLQHRNHDIDITRTHMNQIYKQTQNGMYGEWKDTCKELNITNADNLKKNAIAFEGMVVTSDKEFFERMGYIQGQEPPQKVKEFFDQAYDFAKKEIGFKSTDKNILSAVVHYDETTPHLQLYYVPVVDSWKEKVLQKDENGKVLKNEKGSPIQARDSKGKLMWKNVTDSEERKLSRDSFWKNKGGNTSYTQMQDRFYEQISKEHGLGRGEKGSTREHTTKAEWETEKLNKELVEKRKELTIHQKEVEKLKSDLVYAKDGSVNVLLLQTKAKASEVQEQNKALRLEVKELTQQVHKLKSEVEKLEKQEQERIESLKVRTSTERKSLDALDSQELYHSFMAYVKENHPDTEKVMQQYDKAVEQAHKYGSDMVLHKRGYVDCLERRKTAQNDILGLQERKYTLETDLKQIEGIQDKLNSARNQLENLEQEKNQLSKLNPRQLGLSKQIKECSAEINGYVTQLESQFDMKNRTDRIALSDEVYWYEGHIKRCKQEIIEKTQEINNLTVKAQEHLQEYKILQKSKEGLKEPIKRIVDRYDKEFVPTQGEYRLTLEHYNREGLPKGQAQEKEAITRTLSEVKNLVDHKKAENIVKDKPSHEKSKEQYRSR